jgi:hypothetical protein
VARLRKPIVALVLAVFALMTFRDSAAWSVGAADQPPCRASWNGAPAPKIAHKPAKRTTFAGVDGSSPDDVWAVGGFTSFLPPPVHGHPIAEHWDGEDWSIVSLPPLDGAQFGDVKEVSPTDVWAVGGTSAKPLVAKWNGLKWSAVPTPTIPGAEVAWFDAVDAVSANDVWAVGAYQNDAPTQLTLIEHWDGRHWSIVPSPSPDPTQFGDNGLADVVAVSSNDVWAVGSDSGGGHPVTEFTLIEHWDGSTWAVVDSPSPGTAAQLFAVARSGDDLWAAGGTDGQTLVVHRVGSQWSVVNTPPSRSEQSLQGIAAVAPGDIWFVGSQLLSRGRKIIADHWDGAELRSEPMPRFRTKGGTEFLDRATVLPDGTIWSVGSLRKPSGSTSPLAIRLCAIHVDDSGFAPGIAVGDIGLPISWTVASDATDHVVEDASRMGLFKSAVLGPGQSFLFTPPGAGTYSILDEPTKSKGALEIQPDVNPTSGSQQTQFTLTWAVRSPPAGYVFQVEVARPSAGFVRWLGHTRSTAATFIPDAGVGTYSVRVRVERTSNGAHSNWSPPAPFQVT